MPPPLAALGTFRRIENRQILLGPPDLGTSVLFPTRPSPHRLLIIEWQHSGSSPAGTETIFAECAFGSWTMAKLYLKFEDRILRQALISRDAVTIGRQPDNILQIDNPAVSGHHAKVYWEADHYVLEDTESFNGTYVNNQRISKVILKDGDKVLIGKHTIEFSDQADAPQRIAGGSVGGQAQPMKIKPPQLARTSVLDTAKAKEMFASLAAAAPAGAPAGIQTFTIGARRPATPAAPAVRQTIGMLTIVKGRTGQESYVLTGTLTVIGRSKMAGIRLKRWFAPRVAASICRAEDGYFIFASGSDIKLTVNDAVIAGGQKQLNEGDVIGVAGIKAVFSLCKG